MGFWGFDRNPLLNLAQWQSKYVNTAVLTICHIKQQYTTVSVACMQLHLTDTIYSY